MIKKNKNDNKRNKKQNTILKIKKVLSSQSIKETIFTTHIL
jgi:hypothetical protein